MKRGDQPPEMMSKHGDESNGRESECRVDISDLGSLVSEERRSDTGDDE